MTSCQAAQRYRTLITNQWWPLTARHIFRRRGRHRESSEHQDVDLVFLRQLSHSLKLLGEIDKQGEKYHRIINCLLQVHIAEEEQKFGFIPQELDQFLQNDELKNRNHIKVIGLMGMATFSEDLEKLRVEFRNLKTLFDQLKSKYTSSNVDFKVLSMGMTGDYPVAIKEGSTMIRVGTAIFGTRN